MKQRIHIIIKGRVQGVFFRAQAKRQAQIFNITGWIKNNPDGSVELIAEGEEDNLNQLQAWCTKGPDIAKVENIKAKQEEYKGEFTTFSVKY